MEFLYSNHLPLKTNQKNFQQEFFGLLPASKRLDIGVGYITNDSLLELKTIVEQNNIEYINLVIGMHYLEKFTKIQYDSALLLNDFLKQEKRGSVKLVLPFRFHGKMYSYSNDNGAFAGILGSDNLGSIVENKDRTYEASVVFKEIENARKMRMFIDKLSANNISRNIDEVEIKDFKKNTALLENHDGVEYVLPQIATFITSGTGVSFDIPVPTSGKSSLNVYFGKGRETKKTGVIKARHWYECELIVSKQITSKPGYPRKEVNNGIFDVVTDDGWKFTCKVEGDYGKNLRSQDDLKILGKWIKGRLEEAGALEVGKPVTEEVLRKYGRNTFKMRKTATPDLWFLDFGVRK